jgi:hypothetical protein
MLGVWIAFALIVASVVLVSVSYLAWLGKQREGG